MTIFNKLDEVSRLPIKQDFEDMRKVVPLDVVKELIETETLFLSGREVGYQDALVDVRETLEGKLLGGQRD